MYKFYAGNERRGSGCTSFHRTVLFLKVIVIRIHMAASADVEPTGLSKPFEGPVVRVKKMKRTQSLWMELTGDGLLVLVCFLRGEF